MRQRESASTLHDKWFTVGEQAVVRCSLVINWLSFTKGWYQPFCSALSTSGIMDVMQFYWLDIYCRANSCFSMVLRMIHCFILCVQVNGMRHFVWIPPGLYKDWTSAQRAHCSADIFNLPAVCWYSTKAKTAWVQRLAAQTSHFTTCPPIEMRENGRAIKKGQRSRFIK